MDFSCSVCVSIFSFVIDFFTFGSVDMVAKPPPFNITQTALLRYMSLGEVTNIDLPAIYVFGDSMIDPGNNNFLNTSLKSNFKPYGIDFNGKPTGRVTNGRTVVDFLGMKKNIKISCFV